MRRLLILAAALSGASPAFAQSTPLMIAPTTVTIPSDRRSAVLEIVNQSDSPVDLQFRAYAWSQSGDADNLVPTDAVVVSPTIVTIAPRGRQLFRVLHFAPAPKDHEQSYRLRLNQIPKGIDRGVGINLEFMLPLFVGGSDLPPRVSLSTEDGVMHIANTGARHVKVSALTAEAGGTTIRIPAPHGGYVLAGSMQTWPSSRTIPANAHIVAATEFGPVDVMPAPPVANRRFRDLRC